MDKRKEKTPKEIAKETYESWIVDSVEEEPKDCQDCDNECNGSCDG